MARPDPAVLCFPGAVCSVGTNLAEIASATNAGIRRLASDKRLCFKASGVPVPLGRVEPIDQVASSVERMFHLARHAMQQSVEARAASLGLPPDNSLESIPILLSVPAARPSLPDEAIDGLVASLLGAAGPFDKTHSGAVRVGHDGFAAVLGVALNLLDQGTVSCCLVGAVDSGIDSAYVHWLEDTGRLRSRQQPHGVAPGEAAGFFFLTNQSELGDLGAGEIEVVSVARNQEPNPWYLGKATMGEGLTFAVRQAIAGESVDVCYADLNGESWRSAEWDFAYLRNGKHFAHPLDIRHPSEAWGDIGAASGALLTLLAAWDLSEGMLDHRSALVCTSSDTQPSRAACRITLIESV